MLAWKPPELMHTTEKWDLEMAYLELELELGK
jgi:hypothetical protein